MAVERRTWEAVSLEAPLSEPPVQGVRRARRESCVASFRRLLTALKNQ